MWFYRRHVLTLKWGSYMGMMIIGAVLAIAVVIWISSLLAERGQLSENLAACRSEWYDCKEKLKKKEEQILLWKYKVDKISQGLHMKDALYEKLKEKNDESLEYFATLMADFVNLQHAITSNSLEVEPPSFFPYSSNARKDDLKEMARSANYEYKLLQYKYEHLLFVFPELEEYLNSFDTISRLKQIDNIEELVSKDNYKLIRQGIDFFETRKRTERETQAILKKYKILNDNFVSKLNRLDVAIAQIEDLRPQITNKEKNAPNAAIDAFADFLTIHYEIAASYLKNKVRPAIMEAERIAELKQNTREILYQYKIVEYKYAYLFQLFPDLELYVDDFEAMAELDSYANLDDFKDTVDKTRHYLSKEEYSKLPEDDRNQLALERYIESRKSNWQIGRDYELFMGYVYSQNGWDVEYFGIDKQLSDMGRDLIARKDKTVHIVQCKYWAKEKLIHEKHIAQLYGTTVQYMLSTSEKDKVIVPVFATNISLSETAKLFASHLGVKVIENKKMEDFPRIKCNINKDENGVETKIYHLPMDQQYDRTKINHRGEFFAFTVAEAVNAGFRRAWRWYGNV